MSPAVESKSIVPRTVVGVDSAPVGAVTAGATMLVSALKTRLCTRQHCPHRRWHDSSAPAFDGR